MNTEGLIRRWLSHPLSRDLDIDDPAVVAIRRRIIQEKASLRDIYHDWYESVLNGISQGPEPLLELGSGAGFLVDYVPELITSDILRIPDVSVVMDGHAFPFGRGTLRGVVMINVLHHLSRPCRFFEEAARCVRPGGTISMIEPWVTRWSRFVYGRFHHEPFDAETREWDFPSTGPLSGANEALPWIIFHRDRARFEQRFPEWRLKDIRLSMPFRYLLSGGLSLRTLVPYRSFRTVRRLEDRMGPWMGSWAMFASIVLVRSE